MSGRRRLRLGIVGLGRAAGLMIPSLASHPDVVLAAAADPIAAARERFAAEFGTPTFVDAASLCASGLVDGIYIATPHGQHAADVIAAAECGIHAVVEKPMALTLDDCRRMNAAAARAGTVLVVGHTHAFDPPVALMGRLIASGRFGRLRTVVNLVYTDFLYRPRRPEELDSAQGGGIMYNQVPHQLEIVRELTGCSPRSVRAVTGRWDAARPTEGAMSAFLTFDDGAVAQLTYSGYDRFDTDEFHEWVGESGEQKSDGRHGTTRRRLHETAPDPVTERRLRESSGYGGRGTARSSGAMYEPHFGFLLASCEGADLRAAPNGVTVYADEGVSDVPCPPARVYPNKAPVIDEFYEAVVNGVPARHDGACATATMSCALALIASAMSGREVVVEPELVA